jgi:uncharacterized protein
MRRRRRRVDLVLRPVSGKALPVHKGEILRLTQIEGEQCVDFNAFNLHDYKEHLGQSSTRSHTWRPRQGDIIWTQHSRYRPMYLILYMPDSCTTDVLGGRCSSPLRLREGFGTHTNCQDTLAEAIGEYALTPDDVHDSLNIFANTQWDSSGNWRINPNTSKKGDHVDLLAIMDTLAVPVLCGGIASNNFSYKPIRIEVFEPTDESLEISERIWGDNAHFTRSLSDFRIQEIRADRELTPVRGYEARFINYPIVKRTIRVRLSPSEHRALRALRGRGLGSTDGDTLRAAFIRTAVPGLQVPDLP